MEVEMQAIVGQAESDEEARAKILESISKSFQIRAITPIAPPKKRTSLWATYKDGFRTFISRFDATAE